MAPPYVREICRYSTPRPNINGTLDGQEVDNDEFNALLYIVVTLLFYSLGIIIGIIMYLKRERREMEEDKVFDDFLTWQTDPFTTIKAKRVQQVAARLREIEELQKQRDLELFQQELVMGASDRSCHSTDMSRKSNSLKVPRLHWSKSSWKRRSHETVKDCGGSSEDFRNVPMQVVAGVTGIACQFITPRYHLKLTPPPKVRVVSETDLTAATSKSSDRNERRNCLTKTPQMKNSFDESLVRHGDDNVSDTSSILPFIDTSPVDPEKNFDDR